MTPAEAYNATLVESRRQYLLYLLRSEVSWQQRMQQAGDQAQAIILEHRDAGGNIVRRAELERRLRMLSQSLAADLDRHLRDNMTTAAMLGAKGTADAHKAFHTLAKAGGRK